MADLDLQFGGDLQITQNGDLNIVDGNTLTQERVLRRLLTNKSGYIWHLDYGAGLGEFVGQTGNPDLISGIIRVQMQHESQVMKSPAPVVETNVQDNGVVATTITYVDSITSLTSQLSFSI